VVEEMSFNIDAYCSRIKYHDARVPTLKTLQALHWLHPQAIPYENLDPLLGRPVRLDTESLQRKMLDDGRGGYCYEQNLLFAGALRALGFEVTELAARVLWGVPTGMHLPRTHLLLTIMLDGERFVADVGFGGNVLTAPLRLDVSGEQNTPHGPFQLIAMGDGFILQAKVKGEWTSLYRFDFAEQVMADHEQGNWYVTTHPHSRFLTSLMTARPDEKRRRGLLNNELVIHEQGEETRKTVLNSASKLRDALINVFGIRLPQNDPKLEGILEHFAGGAGEWKL
jgi:N-hydroxyarylamine O-acetyltransferase